MVVLTKLAIANPLNSELRAGRVVEVYSSTTILLADALFNTPSSRLRPHLFDPAPAPNDWIAWGDALFVRARSLSDEASATNGVEIEYSNDGISVAGNIFQATSVANVQLDSGWLPKQGTHFRHQYLNGGTDQGSLDITVEASPALPDSLVGPVSKEITFTGASGLGLVGTFATFFTVTGEVEIVSLVPITTLALVASTDTATISLGVPNAVALFIAALQATLLATNENWIDNTGGQPADAGVNLPDALKNVAIRDDIIVDSLVENVDGGSLRLDLYWRRLSAGGNLVAVA